MITYFYLFAFHFPLVADRSSGTYTVYFPVVEPQSSCYQTEVSIILCHCSSPVAHSSLAFLLSAYRYTCSQCSLHVIRLSISIVRLHPQLVSFQLRHVTDQDTRSRVCKHFGIGCLDEGKSTAADFAQVIQGWLFAEPEFERSSVL